MLNSRFVCRFTGAVALSFAGALGAAAQIVSTAIPAEFPPESYTANQYIDSQGCAFIRAGLSGNTTWVPRVSRERNQLCGFQSTLSSPPVPEAIPDNVPVIVPVATAAPAPVIVPRPTPNVGAPISTVAGLTTPPLIRIPAPTPAVVPMPAAVRAPAPAPAAAAVSAPSITLAEACRGRFGIQTRFISSRTGQPIDCGQRPATQPVTVPADILAPQIQRLTPAAATAASNDPFPGVRRATLSEICAEIAVTGGLFVNVATGQRIVCSATIATVQPPRAPTGPVAIAGPSSPGLTAPVTVAGVNAIRTGPQTQSPSGVSSAFIGQQRTVARTPTAFEELLSPSPVPASNPIRAQVQHIRPPAGYERVWDDGRVNLNRGVPQPVSGQVVSARELSRAPAAAPQQQTQQIVRTAAPAPQATAQAAPSHRFIQVGTYGNPANADAASARLRSLGLPVGFANATRNGQQLRIVAAGPFSSAAQLNAALQAVRSAGYGDAFARN